MLWDLCDNVEFLKFVKLEKSRLSIQRTYVCEEILPRKDFTHKWTMMMMIISTKIFYKPFCLRIPSHEEDRYRSFNHIENHKWQISKSSRIESKRKRLISANRTRCVVAAFNGMKNGAHNVALSYIAGDNEDCNQAGDWIFQVMITTAVGLSFDCKRFIFRGGPQWRPAIIKETSLR